MTAPPSSNHHNGPWRAVKGSPGGHPDVWEIVADLGDHCYQIVANVSMRFTGTFEKIDEHVIASNARLIAAAPDLLALARRYASECAECGGSGEGIRAHGPGPEDEYAEPCEGCSDIWAVINQAEIEV